MSANLQQGIPDLSRILRFLSMPFHDFEIFFHEIFFLNILKVSTLHFYGWNLFKMTHLEEQQEKLLTPHRWKLGRVQLISPFASEQLLFCYRAQIFRKLSRMVILVSYGAEGAGIFLDKLLFCMLSLVNGCRRCYTQMHCSYMQLGINTVNSQ